MYKLKICECNFECEFIQIIIVNNGTIKLCTCEYNGCICQKFIESNCAILDDWAVVKDRFGEGCIEGKVYGHPRHSNSKRVVTSPVNSIDCHERTFITKTGTKYILGNVKEEYEKLYSNAKERFFSQNK